MRIKGFFYLLAVGLLLLGSAWLAFAASFDGWLVYGGVGLVLLLLLYLLFFYRKLIKPLDTLANGMDLLREQDFGSRLRPVGQYEVDRVVHIFNRMMEQLKNERLRLREQNTFLDLLINASPMGVVITTFDEELSELNPAALRMLHLTKEEVQGKKLKELDVALARELTQVPMGVTATVRLNDSSIYRCTHSYFVDRGFQHPFYLIESLTDEVMKAEKKAYEKVIRMIAHEVNNTTAGITSTLDTVEQALACEKGLEDLSEVMHVCTERCYSMSRFITRFADVVKIPEPMCAAVELNELLFSCKRFMEGMCADHNIMLRMELEEDAGKVQVDAALIEQAVVNIIKNSVESIKHDGTILLRTLLPAVIEISDNGKGISKEAEDKLFSPFFSTKPHGQGIGLLFIREVLMRHGCTFSLRTYADGWTRFRIVFPVSTSGAGKMPEQ